MDLKEALLIRQAFKADWTHVYFSGQMQIITIDMIETAMRTLSRERRIEYV